MSNENTENNESTENNEEQSQPNELDLLKQRADTMGITYHPNIGIEKLKEKINDKLAPPEEKEEGVSQEDHNSEMETIQAAQNTANADTFTPGRRETPAQLAAAKRKEMNRLVRIRVSNMNPVNANLKGVLAQCGNSQVGVLKKFIPFNVAWHVPKMLLGYLQNKQFVTHYEVKDNRGRKIKRKRLINEFSIEILPPLTGPELQELKQRQIIAGSVEE